MTLKRGNNASFEDRVLYTFDERAERAFHRLAPLPMMRKMAFNPDDAPDNVNDVAISTLNRALGYTGEEILKRSDPYIYLKDNSGKWGRAVANFLDNSLIDTIAHMGDFLYKDIAVHDPVLKTLDVIDDPSEQNVAERALWNHDPKYGVGLRGGGPSVFYGGKITHHRMRFLGYYLRANLRGYNEPEFENGLVMPLGRRTRLSTGLRIDLINPDDIRYAIRMQHRLWKDVNLAAGASFSRENAFFAGLTRSW
jgi:hypothetical protein